MDIEGFEVDVIEDLIKNYLSKKKINQPFYLRYINLYIREEKI